MEGGGNNNRTIIAAMLACERPMALLKAPFASAPGRWALMQVEASDKPDLMLVALGSQTQIVAYMRQSK